MYLFHSYFSLPNHNTLFFYIESNILVIYSSLGLIKVKHPYLRHCYLQKEVFFFDTMNIYLDYFLNSLFILINYGYIQKYRLRGLGYRQMNYYGDVLQMKLRYSNVLFRYLPFSLLTYSKLKKRKFYTIYGLDKPLVNKYVKLWISFRVANTYTKKGFFKKHKIIFFKDKKKR